MYVMFTSCMQYYFFKSFLLYFTDQLASIRGYEFPRILCDVIRDMTTMQPWPLKQVSADNLRRRCSTYTTLDFTPWQENRRSENANAAIKQGKVHN